MRRALPGGPSSEIIRSTTNPTLKYVRSLHERRTRAEEQAFVVEGERAVADALDAGAVPLLVLLREGRNPVADDPIPLLRDRGVSTRVIAAPLFDELSETVTPQGLLAVFPIPALALNPPRAPLYLVVDRMRDPGNLGTLLRAAAGAGATAAFLTPETVDPYNGKVVRAAVGAHFRLPIRELAPDVVDMLVVSCPLRAVAEADGTVTYDALDWTQPAVVVIGSEARGVGSEWMAHATASVRIPLNAGVESLNAAVAGAIILFEAARQRRRGPGRGARSRRGGAEEKAGDRDVSDRQQ